MCPHNCFTNIFYTVLCTDYLATKGHKPERSNKFTFQTVYKTITYTKDLVGILEHSLLNAKVESVDHSIKVMK